MTKRSLLEIPSGVQCFFGREARLRRDIEHAVADVFRGWSYEELVLPLFDFDDVFATGGGTEPSGGMYRFIGRKGEVLALRPDFTALVAKVVVSRLTRAELPLRLFYSGEVLRYQPPRAGQQEELFQIGLEHLGSKDLSADLEVLLVALESLERLGVDDAVLTLGHVGFALELLRASDDEVRVEALESMRRHDREGIRKALGPERASTWLALMELSGGREALAEARKLDHGVSESALSRLEGIAGTFEELSLGDRIRLDLGAVRGFDYYTGMVFEIHAEGAGLELGGGGRYDSLLGRFGRDLPAIGFYLSLDRIAELLARRGLVVLDEPPEPIAVGETAHGLDRALELRASGRRVRVRKP